MAGLSTSVDPTAAAQGLSETTAPGSARQHGDNRDQPVLLNPFCPFSTAKVLALKATVLLLLTLLVSLAEKADRSEVESALRT